MSSTKPPKSSPAKPSTKDGPSPTGSRPPKKRVGKVVKPDKKTPASFEPGSPATPPPPPFDAKAIAEGLELWRLDGAKGCHLRRSKDGDFIDLSADDLSRCLKRAGVKLKPAEGETLSQADELKDYVQEHRRVDFSMVNLAGFMSGIYAVSGATMVVKKSPKLIVPVEGKWSFMQKLIDGVLDVPGTALSQVILFHAWMKLAMDRNHKDGLALILAGPAGCGKSLLQLCIITPLLGGRSADPGPYLQGQTEFNSELVGSEHLLMEDPAPSKGFNQNTFAEKIKGVVANNTHRFHPKGRDAVTLLPKWHLSISVNDEPDTMKIIPEMRGDIVGKILLLAARRPPKMPGFALPNQDEREIFRDRLASELPAYAYFLQSFNIPDDYREGRFGVKGWQNPALAGQLFEASPAGRLLAMIDEAGLWEIKFRDDLDHGFGSAGEIRGELEDHKTQGNEAKSLFKFSQIEKLLGKLRDTNPERVKHARFSKGPTKGCSYWKIFPPQMSSEPLPEKV